MHSARGQRKSAAVIGGSIGGLFAGLFLRKIGWEVSIHERAGEELGSRGAGIATHDHLHEALALVTEEDGEVGVPVEGRVVLARSGDVVCEVARPRCWHRGIASGGACVWRPEMSIATAARWSRSSRTSSMPSRVSTTAANLLPIFWSPPTASSPRCGGN